MRGTRTTAARATTAAAVGAVLVLGLAACAGAPRGPVVTRDVDIEDVTAVQLATSGDLTIRRGDTPSLTVTAREGTQDRLLSEVRDGVLVLDSRRSSGVGSWGDVSYELVLGEVAELVVSGSGGVTADDVTGDALRLSVEGSGSVDLTGVDAGSVALRIAGSGDVELGGRTDSLAIGIEGSGGVDADRLRADEVDVSVEGSGDVEVHATRRLAVSIEGSGSVSYAGDPEVTQRIEGSGEVSRED